MAKKMKAFKKHTMYSKSGKSQVAKTYAEHLKLKKKGWGHSKPKGKEVWLRRKRRRPMMLVLRK